MKTYIYNGDLFNPLPPEKAKPERPKRNRPQLDFTLADKYDPRPPARNGHKIRTPKPSEPTHLDDAIINFFVLIVCLGLAPFPFLLALAALAGGE